MGTTYREYETQRAGVRARQERIGIRFTTFKPYESFFRFQPDTFREPSFHCSLSALPCERAFFIQPRTIQPRARH